MAWDQGDLGSGLVMGIAGLLTKRIMQLPSSRGSPHQSWEDVATPASKDAHALLAGDYWEKPTRVGFENVNPEPSTRNPKPLNP